MMFLRRHVLSTTFSSCRSFHHRAPTNPGAAPPRPRTPIVMKDRSPHPGTTVNNGKMKAAVLVDASKVNGNLYPGIESTLLRPNVGDLCLRRYFDYEAKPHYRALETSHGFEWFRVDGFIPVHMQLAADAAHIIEYRKDNLITAIVMVVTESEADAYVKYFDRMKGNGVSLFVAHEKVDCGTASVRAALVGLLDGKIISTSKRPIQIRQPRAGWYEQSTSDIWAAVVSCVREVCRSCDSETSVVSIAFDATCSLVVVGDCMAPIAVSPDEKYVVVGDDHGHVHAQEDHGVFNVMLWMDHRAETEAAEINNLFRTSKRNDAAWSALHHVGGTISPEMEIPKIMWLSRHNRRCYDNAKHFFDLCDFLTYRSTGCDTRSVCALTCKWTFMGHKSKCVIECGVARAHDGWSPGFLSDVGLGDLTIQRSGERCAHVGMSVGHLSEVAAKELGLSTSCAVASGMIDAHAGALALAGLGADPTRTLSMISGTSTCHLLLTESECRVPGVWGPYHSALVPGMWLLEAGQSATGALLEDVLKKFNQTSDCGNIIEQINTELLDLAGTKNWSDCALVASEVHVNPYFHGCRSPLADPSLTGGLVGLRLNDHTTVESVNDRHFGHTHYLATLLALCYDSKSIIEAMTDAGVAPPEVVACTGGLAKNPLFLQLHADVTGIPMVVPRERDSVLVGCAINARCCARHSSNEGIAPTLLSDALRGTMSSTDNPIERYEPTSDEALCRFHRNKFDVFKLMVQHSKEYQQIMNRQ